MRLPCCDAFNCFAAFFWLLHTLLKGLWWITVMKSYIFCCSVTLHMWHLLCLSFRRLVKCLLLLLCLSLKFWHRGHSGFSHWGELCSMHLTDHTLTGKCHIKSICHLHIAPICNLAYIVKPSAFYMTCIWKPRYTAICLLHGINMASIWLSHIAAILIPHRRHMAVPYASCMVFIQKPYGKAICLPCSIHMVAI